MTAIAPIVVKPNPVDMVHGTMENDGLKYFKE